MVVCRLVGSLWATRKYEELNGMKLMRVEVIEGADAGRRIVCVDTVSAGVDDRVLVAEGTAAYLFMKEKFDVNAPVDAAIVGIIDEDVSL